jgi:hypothetical protein
MRPINIASDLNRAGLVLSGGGLVFAEVAWLQMRSAATSGVICGGGPLMLAHCPACYASASLLTLGVAAFVLARFSPPETPSPARSGPHDEPACRAS